MVDVDGLITQFERTSQGIATAIVAPNGQRTTLTPGADGYISAITNPASEGWSFEYGAGGLMATETDPSGAVHRFSTTPRVASLRTSGRAVAHGRLPDSIWRRRRRDHDLRQGRTTATRHATPEVDRRGVESRLALNGLATVVETTGIQTIVTRIKG